MILVDNGTLQPVEHSESAAPIVPVPKKDGTIRICGDFKVTINPYLDVDQYPLPKPSELFACLTGGKKFTKLDMSSAYQQMMLDEESSKLVTHPQGVISVCKATIWCGLSPSRLPTHYGCNLAGHSPSDLLPG